MSSEWMKVMLDEIARKQLEAEQERIEQERRLAEPAPVTSTTAAVQATAPRTRSRA